jgi:hypothetical protein
LKIFPPAGRLRIDHGKLESSVSREKEVLNVGYLNVRNCITHKVNYLKLHQNPGRGTAIEFPAKHLSGNTVYKEWQSEFLAAPRYFLHNIHDLLPQAYNALCNRMGRLALVDGTDIHAKAHRGDPGDHLLLAHEYGAGDIRLDMGILR